MLRGQESDGRHFVFLYLILCCAVRHRLIYCMPVRFYDYFFFTYFGWQAPTSSRVFFFFLQYLNTFIHSLWFLLQLPTPSDGLQSLSTIILLQGGGGGLNFYLCIYLPPLSSHLLPPLYGLSCHSFLMLDDSDALKLAIVELLIKNLSYSLVCDRKKR